MPAPSWSGATPNQPGLAGQVNQFLAAHAVNYLYAGTQVAAQNTLGSGSVASNGLFMAQKFTTGAGTTSIGRVSLRLGLTGTPLPITVSLYADSGGPTGAPLVSTVVPKEFVTAGGASVLFPLPVTVTPSTTYWIVLASVGDPSDFYSWFKSNQVTGASTSPDGVTWTAQAYGFVFAVFDQTAPTGNLLHTWEDNGARWTFLNYLGAQLIGINEYTAGQTAAGYTVSTRTLSYSNGTLTGVA